MGDVGPPLGTIGSGVIGTPPFNWQATVLSQYSSSPILMSLLGLIAQWLDVTTAIDNFFDWVWNVSTAQGWGLDVWGRIVGVGRTLLVNPSRYLGFEEGGTLDYDPFGQSPFFQQPSTGNYVLSDPAYRQLIMAKAAANIWDGSIPQLNSLLNLLFGQSGAAYVRDNADMTITYVFLFAPDPVQLAIIEQAGVLPRPCGCKVKFQVGVS